MLPEVALNIDAGELESESPELYALAHIVNVACGGHAGDDASMQKVVRACAEAGTLLAAHPSYPDREGFGRRALDMPSEAVERAVQEQCARLSAIAQAEGAHVERMKPHGALYHAANRDAELARAVVRGATHALGRSVSIVAPSGGELARASAEAGCSFVREAFADRGIRADGSLIPRGEAGALVHDPQLAARRAAEIAQAGLADTVCVHGDTEGAVAIARAVRKVLEVVSPVREYGDNAFRWAIGRGANRRALLIALRSLPCVKDAIVTEEHACVIGSRPDLTTLAALDDDASTPREIVIRVRYDGVDLDEVAARARLSPEDVVRLHGSKTYEVAMIGFLPGFAYLRDLDPRIAMPRRPTPRPRIPAGSVAVAGSYTGVYPFASPGGWNVIGTAVDFCAFDPASGARLALGDRVRFERAS